MDIQYEIILSAISAVQNFNNALGHFCSPYRREL